MTVVPHDVPTLEGTLTRNKLARSNGQPLPKIVLSQDTDSSSDVDKPEYLPAFVDSHVFLEKLLASQQGEYGYTVFFVPS